MKPGGSARKGGRFERVVCKQLSLWASAGTDTDVFWRTAGSGGRARHASRRAQGTAAHGAQAGDVGATDDRGAWFTQMFYVELKHLRDLEWHRLHEQAGKLYDIWVDTVDQALLYDRRPMLVARQNSRPVVAVLNDLRPWSRHTTFPTIAELAGDLCQVVFTANDGRYNMWLLPFDALLDKVPVHVVRRYQRSALNRSAA